MATELEPQVELAVVMEEDALARGVPEQARCGQVSGRAVAGQRDRPVLPEELADATPEPIGHSGEDRVLSRELEGQLEGPGARR